MGDDVLYSGTVAAAMDHLGLAGNRAAIAGSRPVRDLRALGLRALHGVGPLRRQAMRLGLGAPTAPAAP